jgi:ubiquitin-like 1-activating enzyme E1 B
LDTIDVSNLNRQLLFRSQHVGKAKCIVACEVAAEMVPPISVNENDEHHDTNHGTNNIDLPQITYHAHHGNVCDSSKFNLPFVQQFDLVLNALDNVEARRRVNRLCLAANVPLIEAGTTGYLGQVTVIHKGSGVACYECKTQETAKVYPICTIRSTPSMPVHTIVWAKELYKLLFHSKVEESMLFEDPASTDEPSTYMDAVYQLRMQIDKVGTNVDLIHTILQKLLQDLYATEIQKQLDMGRYQAAKKTPSCLDVALLELGMQRQRRQQQQSPSLPSTTDIWSLEESVVVLAACIQQAATMPKNELLEEFDKDDDLAMRFVTAASNLRSSVFGIEPLQSLYSAKGIAGNIIPAIATTNAICAGLQILQAFKILKQLLQLEHQKQEQLHFIKEKDPPPTSPPRDQLQLSQCCWYVNCIRNRTRNGLYLTASTLEDPNPNCFVCKNAVIPLALNVNEWTLQEFLQRIVKQRLGFEEPTLMLNGDFVWEEGDGAEDDYHVNLPKTLTALPCGGIQHGTVLEIDDNSQNLTIHVSVTHQDVWEGDEVPDYPFTVGSMPDMKKTKDEMLVDAASPAAAAKPSLADHDDDDVILILNKEDVTTQRDKKRPLEHGDQKCAAKKQKTKEQEVIEIDD